MQNILAKLSCYQPFKVIVVGDFMLDQAVYGAAERLSPDAPVPVLAATSVKDSPGGASNVALCLRGLLGEVSCFGVVGADREGEALRSKLAEAGCRVEGIYADTTRPTTVKRSLIGLAQHRHPQKMFRVDFESKTPLDQSIVDQIVAGVRAHLRDADVVCIEDYNKGVCTPSLCQSIISLCREAGKPVLVDPAAIEDYSKYRRATAITPNRSEAELATSMETPIDASELHKKGLSAKLLTSLELDAVVLTLDKQGALLEVRGEPPIHVPTVTRLVYDVTGAGDMVLAALAGGLANGFTWLEAVTFANAAAGLEVEVFGAQPIPLAKVQREILMRTSGLTGKYRDLKELLVELEVHRVNGHRIVLTNGCFDVVHAGHVAYLREAKALGDVLVVGINADDEVRRQKGAGRPVFSAAERVEVLSEFASVDYVTVFHEPTAHDLIRAVHPDVYVKGGDYRREDLNEWDLLGPMVARSEIRVEVVAHRPGLSSSTIIRRVRDNPSPRHEASTAL